MLTTPAPTTEKPPQPEVARIELPWEDGLTDQLTTHRIPTTRPFLLPPFLVRR